MSQEFGIGMAIDIEGNCRFYDLIRFKKMAKVSGAPSRIEDKSLGNSKFNLMMPQNLIMANECFVAVTQF